MAASASRRARWASAPCTGRRHGAEIRQQGRRTGLVLFKGGQQHGGGIAVVGGGRLCQLQGLFHLRGAGFVPGGSQHRADVAVEQFTV